MIAIWTNFNDNGRYSFHVSYAYKNLIAPSSITAIKLSSSPSVDYNWQISDQLIDCSSQMSSVSECRVANPIKDHYPIWTKDFLVALISRNSVLE